MVTATGLFAATWLAQRPGYLDGEVTTLGLILGVGAFGLLILGGTLGGALAYVYGVRVVKQDVSLADALIPGRLEDSRGPSRPVAAPARRRRRPDRLDGLVGLSLRRRRSAPARAGAAARSAPRAERPASAPRRRRPS